MRETDPILGEARAIFANGEFFRSYDLAVGALKKNPFNSGLAHLAVLSLANAGATGLAMDRYFELKLHQSNDLELQSLLGRLKKDQAFSQTGDTRMKLIMEALAIYESVYEAASIRLDPKAYYPGINAATLALMSGADTRSAILAREVLSLVEKRLTADPTTELTDVYWLYASAIEANLLIDDFAAARELLPLAISASGRNYVKLSTTGRQLERILAVKQSSTDIFAELKPPTIIHYVGHIIAAPGQPGRFHADEEADVAARIGKALDSFDIGAAYGSLAAGADMLFVEALQARNVAVNIILPFNIPDMLEQSVRKAGIRWVERFHTCLKAAKTVRYATEDRYLNDDHLFTYCSRLAMGLAVLFARHMHAPLRQFAVWDGDARATVAGTVADMQAWSGAGYPVTVIRCGSRHPSDNLAQCAAPAVTPGKRDTRAMLFGDIRGFSRLTDAQLPIFTRHVMGKISAVMSRFKRDVAFVNTWGDGVFAVFSDAGKAAECAVGLQSAIAAVDLLSIGLPAELRLRIGGHLGPVYELRDPILDRLNYFGVHVSRAARIEPITPEGCVYVTEAFAAVLALQHTNEFACDYVGYTAMAKDYGQMRLFLLRSRTGEFGPRVLTDIERGAVS